MAMDFKKIRFTNIEKNGQEIIVMELYEGGALDLAVARFEMDLSVGHDVADCILGRIMEAQEDALRRAKEAAQETNRQLGICGVCGVPLREGRCPISSFHKEQTKERRA